MPTRLATRPLGRTGHASSLLAFGAAALWPRLWPAMFEAAERFEALSEPERDALVEAERGRDPLYVVSMQPARQAFGPARTGSGA